MHSAPPIRILVADDSLAIRSLLSRVFSNESDIEVVGTASNGRKAIAAVEQLDPDLVVMDVEMPVMDGITALELIRQSYPELPAIVFTSHGDSSAHLGMQVLGMPHTKWLTAPTASEALGGGVESTWEDMLHAIRDLTGRAQPRGVERPAPALPARTSPSRFDASGPYSLLVIGSSTGGPDALTTVFSALPEDVPVPIVIVQHMPSGFTKHLADRLDSYSSLRVKQGSSGDVIRAGHAYVAPGGYHMIVERDGTDLVLRTNQDPKEHSCRPAVDPLFRSAVEACGSRVLGVVLTGMGYDGAAGCAQIREAGGRVLIQDEATSVVWGMPGEVFRTGQADEVHPLDEVAPAIHSTLALAQMRAASPKTQTGEPA